MIWDTKLRGSIVAHILLLAWYRWGEDLNDD